MVTINEKTVLVHVHRRHDKRGQVEKKKRTDTVNYNVHGSDVKQNQNFRGTAYFWLSIKKRNEKKNKKMKRTTNELNIDRLFAQNALFMSVYLIIYSILAKEKQFPLRQCKQHFDILKCKFCFMHRLREMNEFFK